jgi:hypothetical protein
MRHLQAIPVAKYWVAARADTDAARRETAPFLSGMHKSSERDANARERDA